MHETTARAPSRVLSHPLPSAPGRVVSRSFLWLALAATSLTALPQLAHADNWNFKSGPYEIDLGVNFGAGVFGIPNAQFGTGSYDIRNLRDATEGLRKGLGKPVKSPVYAELYVKPEVHTTYHIDDTHALNANVSAVYAQTLGDGDANLFSLTRGNPGKIDVEEAFVGYTAPTLFGIKGDNTVIKLGRQNFFLDDGFLLGDGNFDTGGKGAYYMAPRTAWDWSGTVSFNYEPVRGDIFLLRNTVDNHLSYGRNDFAIDSPRTNLAGFDVEWFQNANHQGADGASNYLDRAKYVNLTFFHIYDATENETYTPNASNYLSRRNGENVVSVGIGGNLVPIPYLGIKDNFTLYGQWVYEGNSGRTNVGGVEYSKDVSAQAYYIEPGYTFSNLPLQPHIYYRYSHFDGQKGSPGNLDRKTSFDPMFYSCCMRAVWGTYFAGEIIGQYVQLNTNQNINMVGATFNMPFHLMKDDDSLKFDVIYYRFNYDHPEAAFASNRHIGDEIDFAGTYNYDERTNIYGVFGMATAGRGLKQSISAQLDPYGNSATFGNKMYIAELFFTRTF
jgi:hypothetical protein